jgi:hypothetical protein
MSSPDNAPANLEKDLRVWAAGAIKAATPDQVLPAVGAKKALEMRLGTTGRFDDTVVDNNHRLLGRIGSTLASEHHQYTRGAPLQGLVENVVQYLKGEADELIAARKPAAI